MKQLLRRSRFQIVATHIGSPSSPIQVMEKLVTKLSALLKGGPVSLFTLSHTVPKEVWDSFFLNLYKESAMYQ